MFFHRTEQPRMEFYRKVAVSFVILAIAVVGVVFYISFSWATIILTSKEELRKESISVRIAEHTNDEQGIIPGRIHTQELEAEGTFTPQLTASIPQKAQGIITLINITSKSQVLRETTRLLAPSGELFRTTEFVTVAPRESMAVHVVADAEGEMDELSHARFILPGLWPGLQDKIYGQGFEPGEGGSKIVHTLMQSDIEKGENQLIAKLQEKFLSLSQTESFQNSFHPKELGSLLFSKILTSTSTMPLVSQTDDFSIRIKAQLTGVFFDESEMRTYARQIFQKELDNGYDLVGLDKQRFEYTLEYIDRSSGKALLSLHASVGRIRNAEYLALEKRSLTGKAPRQVEAYFENLPNITAVRVQLYPFWVTQTPLLHDHITIVMEKKE